MFVLLIRLGAEEVTRNNKENNENHRMRTASTTIAEEAVDQLQASEKLIAGNFNHRPGKMSVLIRVCFGWLLL